MPFSLGCSEEVKGKTFSIECFILIYGKEYPKSFMSDGPTEYDMQLKFRVFEKKTFWG